MGQGWYFGKAMRADQVLELLADRGRNGDAPLTSAVNG